MYYTCSYCNNQFVWEAHACFVNNGNGNIVVEDNVVSLVGVTADDEVPSLKKSTLIEFDDSRTEWSHAAVLLLIDQYRENREQLQKNSLKRHIWLKIVNKMRPKAYTYSSDHLQNKWKSFMRTYKFIKDHHNKTGTNRKSGPYYDLMDEILSDNPTIVPPLLMTNGIVEQTSDAIDKEVGEGNTTETEGGSGRSTPKRKNRESVLLKTILKQSQQQHEERLQKKKWFNNLLETLVEHITTKK
ncbi:hypothetical protein RN001_003569 [Aquatica leii]|uniref:Myb/SANT-like DNA-binding domain-containing protein n=1 Tax=Aquatica leii TaxID=1421715 RepID=A0AAN7QP64_9COLE|nr:hypothetical protein RN001_003569 [Aquatica leii]